MDTSQQKSGPIHIQVNSMCTTGQNVRDKTRARNKEPRGKIDGTQHSRARKTSLLEVSAHTSLYAILLVNAFENHWYAF